MYTVRESTSEKELDAIVKLRYKILREPWGQAIDTARDALESKSLNIYIEDNGKVVACARLQENEGHVGQIRYMAVADDYQGKRLGQLLLSYLEKKAKEKNFEKIELQARENAVGFYSRHGYITREKTFLLWNTIQHYLMEKSCV
jgi:N-acetylglutamate synthase-like GNAT family acetyltransferase